jgi:hypothetical protein
MMARIAVVYDFQVRRDRPPEPGIAFFVHRDRRGQVLKM